MNTNNHNSIEEEARQQFVYTTITDWNARRQFGFVQVDGQKMFIHGSSIKGGLNPKRDLCGEEIVVDKTSIEQKDNKASISLAYTKKQFELQSTILSNAEYKIQQGRELAADKMYLATHDSELTQVIREWNMDTVQGPTCQFYEGEALFTLENETATLESLDSMSGPNIKFTHTFSVKKGRAAVEKEVSCERRGWQYTSLVDEVTPVPSSKTANVHLRIKGIRGHQELPMLNYPAHASPAIREGQEIFQTITVNTPFRNIEQRILLYANPNVSGGIFREPWENIDELKLQVDADAPSKELQNLQREAVVVEIQENGILLDIFPEQVQKLVTWEEIKRIDRSAIFEGESGFGGDGMEFGGGFEILQVEGWGTMFLLSRGLLRKGNAYFKRYASAPSDLYYPAIEAIKKYLSQSQSTEPPATNVPVEQPPEVPREPSPEPLPRSVETSAPLAASQNVPENERTTFASIEGMDDERVLIEWEERTKEIDQLLQQRPELLTLVVQYEGLSKALDKARAELQRREKIPSKERKRTGMELGPVQGEAASAYKAKVAFENQQSASMPEIHRILALRQRVELLEKNINS